MTAFLVLLQRDENWTTYLWFIVFFGVPLLLRLFRWLLVRLGLLRPEDPELAAEARREELRRTREERRRAELEGEELWRRLARGEAVEAPPAAPVPLPTPGVPRETSLEREEEPAALSVLGEVSEPGESPEVSLESAAEPVPLQALSQAAAELALAAAPAARAAFVLARGDMRRSVVLSELLGPPVSERALRS